MDAPAPASPLPFPCISVIRGDPCPEELAAVAAVLLSRSMAMSSSTTACSCSTAAWRRKERGPAFCPPSSWQRG
ncbi:acyl-CoA carboxylase subunit epsilon [Streptomyces sp. CWNU-1]|uniref:Acyl-CoA carboxylase subunit epsilon n=2 Tax=Streptomyces albipurpureus TaxID=2897419 RepID=A0ABT0UUU4_9ACTN|nr:acyl-CoA carboxylase subunit epsilon [Streptomyces sp. CWNU-1]